MHLSPMCVAPNAQGKGVGKTMLKHLCALLDERNIGGYLETGKQSNVQFYQCFGYVVEHESDVYGVKTWSMWRSPQEVADQS
jgi:GNAT superfamily N-acetyltransferase